MFRLSILKTPETIQVGVLFSLFCRLVRAPFTASFNPPPYTEVLLSRRARDIMDITIKLLIVVIEFVFIG